MNKDWTGKKIRILFDDNGRVLSKVGKITFYDAVFCEIKTEKGIEVVPVQKIVRMEVID